MDVKQIAKAALLAQRLSDTAQMRSQHPSWLLAELEDAAETITALLQLARAEPMAWAFQVRDEPAYPGDSMMEVVWTADDAERNRQRGYKVVALVPVPVKEGMS